MPQAQAYQSKFTGAQMDALDTLTEEQAAAIAALEDAVAGKYTLPEGGIPETDMDADVQAALQKVEEANARPYDPQNPDGMGYLVLNKDATFASQVTDTNTVYEIRYNFDLDSAFTMPAGCVLRFVGGSISGAGTLTFSETVIEGDAEITCGIAGTIDGVVNVGWFGLKNNDSTFDNGVVINKVAAAFKKIYLPVGTYYITTPVLLQNMEQLLFDGLIWYIGTTDDVAAVTLKESNGTFVFKGRIYGYQNATINYTGDGGTNIRGLEVQKCNNSVIYVWSVKDFNECLRVSSPSSGGCCYNTFIIGELCNANRAIRIFQDNGGWANENHFYGGRLYCESNWRVTGRTAYAIYIAGPGTASDTYNSCNGLLFVGMSTEGYIHGCSVYAKNIQVSRFEQIRNEGSSGAFIKFVQNCLLNIVNVGYASAASGTGSGGGKGVDITEATSFPLDYSKLEHFEIADLDVYDYARCYKNGSAENFWYFPKHRIINFGYAALTESHYSNNFTEGTLVPNGKGPSVIVDTSENKMFFVRAEGMGRIFIRFLKNSSGTTVEGEDAQKALGSPLSDSGEYPFTSGNYCFQSAVNVNQGVIAIPASVGQIAISFNGGCKRMKVYALGSPIVPVYFADEVLNGPTASRPAHNPIGRQYFDTELGKYILWNGTAWVNLDGSALT